MNAKLKLYLAAPLFSKAELDFNKRLGEQLQLHFDVYLPQEDGGLMVNMIARGMSAERAAHAVFNLDILALKECDLLLIVMDGRAVDEGAAFELGFAHALGKPCYALQTDSRRLLPVGNNPMLTVPLRSIFTQVPDLITWAQSYDQHRPMPLTRETQRATI